MGASSTESTGLGESIDIRQPFAATNYVIATGGIYPSRSLSTEPLIGSVAMFGGNWAPPGWQFCEGQLLDIADNTALFSLLGTTYGGDGRTTFALPDLRGRVPIGVGQGPGLDPIVLGSKVGNDLVSLNTSPSHSHSAGDTKTGSTGGPTTLETTMPSLGLMPVVAIEGLYPSRSLSIEPGLGDVSWFAGNFVPQGWAQANGQLLDISSNTALYSLLGSTFGGDGRTTFALPDLRGRIAVGMGNGPGLSPVKLGERGGRMELELSLPDQLPAHDHIQADGVEPTGSTGSTTVVEVSQPWLALNYSVGLDGSYPARSLAGSSVDDSAKPPSAEAVLHEEKLIPDQQAYELIAPLLQTSRLIWKQLGAKRRQLSVLKATSVQFDNLDATGLAQVTSDQSILLDRDARGRGWFVDSTPLQNREFPEHDQWTGALAASKGPASGHYDLLTTILHEQAHLLDQNHIDHPADLMYGSLSTGIRKLPDTHHLSLNHQSGEHLRHKSHALVGTDSSIIGAIEMSARNFAPRGSALANGQLLDISISQNQALFSVLGTTYGGDGRSSFALPDLRGRSAIGMGQGPGLLNYRLGSTGGREAVTLTTEQLPVHSHSEPTLTDSLGLDHPLVDAQATFTIQQSSMVDGDATFINNGELTNESTLSIDGELINNGTFTNDGVISINGTMNTSNGKFVNNRTISGSGIIEGSYIDTGKVKPGNSTGGILIDGNFIKNKGRLILDLAGSRHRKMNRKTTTHDFLEVLGDAQLGGNLKIKLRDDYIIKPGKKHKVIKIDGERFGTFKNYAEGDAVEARNHSGEKLFISYEGGDGNDVILYAKDDVNASKRLAHYGAVGTIESSPLDLI